MKRRQLLTVGASAFTVVVAGCTGDDGDGAPTMDEDEGGGLYGDGGGDGTSEATETATATDTEPTETATSDDSGGGDATVVTVGASGETRFDPEEVTVAVGETVRWEWAAGGHNVRPDSQPADADWSGTPGGDGETYDEEYTYEFPFEVPGRYEYYCAPHRSFGMVGTVVVEE